MTTAPAGIRIGDVLRDQYRVEGVLGEGGMGTVYSVVDVQTKQVFAMKVVVDGNEGGEHVTRFFREGRATMRLRSDHVVRVYDVGQLDDSTPFMVMERLDGRTLKELVDGRPLDERTVADLGLQACEGLAHAHALGIVHRDVKPSNLFVSHGADLHLKVLDFGISRVASLKDWERTATVTVTETHALLGSPHYVSPEQLQNPSKVDGRADVWSLGVSMYYALTGKLPFGGTSLAELLIAVMSKQVPSLGPTDGRYGVSKQMAAIVSRCIERSTDRRYQNVAELADALAEHGSPRRAALAPRIRGVLSAGANTKSAPPPAPAATPRQVADRTMTVNEPLPDVALALGAAASAVPESQTSTAPVYPAMRRSSAPPPPMSPMSPMLSALSAEEDLEEAPTVAVTGGLADPHGASGVVVVDHNSSSSSSASSSSSSSHTNGSSVPFNVVLAAEQQARRQKRAPMIGLFVVIGAVATVAVLVVTLVVITTRRATTAAAAASASTAVPEPSSSAPLLLADPTSTPAGADSNPTAAAGAAAADPTVQELELIVDGRVAKVIRPATIRRMLVEDGKAIVTVGAFQRDLPIEVELASGARAKGVAKVGGPKTIHLVAVGTAPGKPGTKGSASTSSSGPKPAKSGSELHGSPYE